MITDEVLRSYVSGQIDSATGTLNSDISAHRGRLLDRYMGELYGDEVEGRSKQVMSDVADTIEWIMPEMMEIFAPGRNFVEFKPVGPEDEEAAKQETAVTNHIVTNKNDGFLVIYQMIKDALLQKNGIVKSFWEENKRTEIEEYEDLTSEELMVVASQISEGADEVKILEQNFEEGEMPAEGISVKIQSTRTEREYRILNVPPEEFLVAPKWNSIFLDGCPFQAHKATKTVSDLIAMGFDRKQAKSLPDDQKDMDAEEIKRFDSRNNSEYSERTEADPSMREVMLHECYVYMDRDEDGIAELLQVYIGGEHGELMRWSDGSAAIKEVSHAPFDAITPVIMSHKFFGRSIAELVEDLQRVRTVLVRQLLDNVYVGNNARPHVDMNMANDQTIEDLLNTQVGYPIRGKGPMAGVNYAPIPNVTAPILQAVEYIDHLRENRTGVTKYNQGLDANSLNKTASGIRSIMSASQKKILLIARIFAETGLKSLVRRVHRDMRRGPVKEIAEQIRGKWISVNPRVWRERTDMVASVGLGTGDKDQQLARLDAILERQIQAMQANLAGPEQVLHTLHKMVEAAGFQSPEMFFSPQQPAPQPQQTDPMQAAAAIEMGKAQIKAQSDLQREEMRIAGVTQKAAIDAAIRREEMSQDATQALMDDDRERDIALARLSVEIAKMQADGETAISLAAIERMMAQ